jgi:aromatic-L-amino-acid/L-tryptophan decarboxylase
LSGKTHFDGAINPSSTDTKASSSLPQKEGAMLEDPARQVMELHATSLDPQDWSSLRALGHRMLDDMFDSLDTVGDGPVWRKMPPRVREALQGKPLPHDPSSPGEVYDQFQHLIAPYTAGNRHGRFLGWVHGGGNAVGALGEMLAGFLNANCGGRDHAPILVERQVIAWAAEMLGFPDDASGVLLTGSSMANFAAILVARVAGVGADIRENGVSGLGLVGYAAQGAHMCLARGFDMAGIGEASLRLIDTDAAGRMRPDLLRERIVADRAAGLRPFMVAGTAGSVDIGALDDLSALADICAAEKLWLHVDAAFGALAMLSPRLRPRLNGMERADSVAFDFHKWAQMPYDAGCLMVRDAEAHRAAFAHPAAYLARATHGLSACQPWPVDLGPELSRGFRALKVWMTLATYGADKLGAVVEHSVDLAQRFKAMIEVADELEMAAPVALNIVCFRVRGLSDDDHLNLAADVQESGDVVFSTTVLDGRVALRVAFVVHRATAADLPIVLSAVRKASKAYLPGGL